MLGTDDVLIDVVTIRNAYCEGIDPDSCRNVRIANCHIESRDDAIVPKASFSLGEGCTRGWPARRVRRISLRNGATLPSRARLRGSWRAE